MEIYIARSKMQGFAARKDLYDTRGCVIDKSQTARGMAPIKGGLNGICGKLPADTHSVAESASIVKGCKLLRCRENSRSSKLSRSSELPRSQSRIIATRTRGGY